MPRSSSDSGALLRTIGDRLGKIKVFPAAATWSYGSPARFDPGGVRDHDAVDLGGGTGLQEVPRWTSSMPVFPQTFFQRVG